MKTQEVQKTEFSKEKIPEKKEKKTFVIIIILLTLLLIVLRKNFLTWFLYVLFYPAIILFWKIPYFIFRQKSWALAFAVLNSIISFFKSLKYTFFAFAFYIITMSF